MVTAMAVVTAGAGLGAPAVAAEVPQPAASLAGESQASRGVLRVKVIGKGKYRVVGEGVRKTGHSTRSFTLAPGRYRVKASGISDSIVRVRAGRTTRIDVVFLVQTPTNGVVSRISIAADGTEGDWSTLGGVYSPDGTKVLLTSKATTLVPEPDVNGDRLDLYIRTVATGDVVRVSTNSQGEQGNDASTFASWSPDGTKILFDSVATNLVPNDTNGAPDVFVKDLTSGAVTRVSTDAKGRQVKGSQSNYAAWSPDGTRIAFDSYASTLVPKDTNKEKDVFVKTLATGGIQRISVDAQGKQCEKDSRFPMWSPDSRRVMIATSCAFEAKDTNKWVDAYVKTLASGAMELVATDSNGAVGNRWSMPDGWAPDGQRIVFTSDSTNLVPNDTNEAEDVFLKNLGTGQLDRISTDAEGGQGSGGSANSVWSPDGERVAFTSDAPDLVPKDTNDKEDVFVKTLSTGEIELVSLTKDGEQGNEVSTEVTWSPDASQVLVVSAASNFVPDDTNESFDVFLVDAP